MKNHQAHDGVNVSVDVSEQPHNNEPAITNELGYKYHRERITTEDNLINHRLTWLLVPQAVLYGFCATTFAKGTIGPFELLLVALVACLGIVTCALGWFSIMAAAAAITLIQQQYRYYWPCPDPKLPFLSAPGNLDAQGMRAAKWLPLCFIVAWLLLVLLGILVHLATQKASNSGV